MIIDIHGHYTTEPSSVHRFRDRQLASILDPARIIQDGDLKISDEELIESVQPQLTLQRERGCDVTLFSPRAAGMAHHIGSEDTGRQWSRISNNLTARICDLLPNNFAAVGQLPQRPGVSPKNCLQELERLASLGFVGVNLNPDPTGGYWTDPPLTEPYWYPLYEKLVELQMPAMIHVSSSCNPNFHHTGAHYINADTTAFMQLLQGDLFDRYPLLKFIIPHGGGAVPYHWGRYRGLAMMLKKEEPVNGLLRNVYFDTCVYHVAGMSLLTQVIPIENILFASEMLGAVKAIDPTTGYQFDDTKRYLDQLNLSPDAREKIFCGNALKVFPQLEKMFGDRCCGPVLA